LQKFTVCCSKTVLSMEGLKISSRQV
jgi:hypothetical protein